jgi:hypothetical protein
MALWRGGHQGPALLIGGTMAFFLATGSVSHFVGARLRFPADLVAAPLAGIGLFTLVNSFTASPPAPPGETGSARAD